MATYTHTWKLGEVCKGGIITVEIHGNEVAVIGKEWDFSTGSRRSSDQSNAQEFTRLTVTATADRAKRNVLEKLQDLTTSYYADKVLEWIESKVKLSTQGDGWYW